ncbi:PRS27 protease, partial [Fregata magnificens]|nr:PRS27 protease [Fregata magnificens]
AEDLPSPRRLQKLEVPIMAQSTCRRLYGIDMGRALPPRRIQDDMMCAGYAEGLKDTCKVRRFTSRCHRGARRGGGGVP